MAAAPRHASRRLGLGPVLALVLVVLLAAALSPAGSATPAPAAAAPCFQPANGLDRCRDYLGASVGDDPSVGGDVTSQFALHERRYGAIRIVHLYARNGGCHLDQDAIDAAGRAGGYLFLNWHPVLNDWATATGGDQTVNACIATMADDIAALGRPIFLALWHEAGHWADAQAMADAGCPYTVNDQGVRVYPSSGTSGTAADYRGMWANVQSIFAAHGATNVYWSYVTMTDANHLCMTNALYPTGSKVDWIGLDQYGASNVSSYDVNTSRMVRWLNANSIAAHPYNRRPWALAEWGWLDDGTPPSASLKGAYFNAAAAGVADEGYPGIHMYLVFDNRRTATTPYDPRVAYAAGAPCQYCQNRYGSFAAVVRRTIR